MPSIGPPLVPLIRVPIVEENGAVQAQGDGAEVVNDAAVELAT